MPRCFVIQPFDNGPFDKRYKDIFAPAIVNAGLEPYRVDRDPSVTIPIEEIQAGIESSEICLAEISIDNPNVWFSLATQSRASERWFSYVRRNVNFTSPSTSSTDKYVVIRLSRRATSIARSQITTKLKALLDKKARLGQLAKLP